MKNTFVKVLLVFLLALSLIGLASCKNDSETNTDTQPQTSHTHAFGEWTLIKEATLNEEGAEERTCSCGEVETRTVATTPSSVGLKYAVNPDGETCTIRGIGTCTDTKIIIGQTIDGYRVTAIGLDAFFNCTTITDVVIADSVTSIGTSAFAHCEKLTSITLPKNLDAIKKSTFSDCTSLKQISIPVGVTVIENRAFYNCKALESVELPEGLTTIENLAFRSCTELKNVDIPDTVTLIGNASFSGCDNALDVEGGITYIDTWAMDYDKKTSYVIIRDGTKGLADGLFSSSTVLTGVSLPDTLTYIGDDVFNSCKGLTSLIIPNSVTHLGKISFKECYEL